MRVADKKRSKPNRLGDLMRVVWRPADKTQARCLEGDWSTGGIGYPNVCRAAREHTRLTGHHTRVASIEMIEYQRAGSSAG